MNRWTFALITCARDTDTGWPSSVRLAAEFIFLTVFAVPSCKRASKKAQFPQ